MTIFSEVDYLDDLGADWDAATELRYEAHRARVSDLCEICRNDVVVESEDFCRACLDELGIECEEKAA